MDRRFALSSPVGKSLVPLSSEDARLDPFLGKTIRKIFGSQWYYGQVIAIDVDVASGERAYHIAYEDGDEEHLSTAEVRSFLVMPGRSAPPSEPGSPRRSVVPSHRPSIARTEAPRPSVAPSISAAVPSFAGSSASSSAKPNFSFWGSMMLAGLTGAFLVALASSFLSFMMSSGELADGLGTRVPMPVGLVAPLPPWAEVETTHSAKAAPSGGSPQVVEIPAPEEKPVLPVAEDVPVAQDVPSPEETIETQEQASQRPTFEAHFPLGEAEEHQETATPKEEPETSGDEPLGTQLIDDSALEEDLSVAVAAVVEASGLVVRVVAKSFFRSLEEVWHWILSSFSSGLSGALFGAAEDPPPVPAPAPTPEPEEAAGALQSLMTTILVAMAGVVTILVNVHPPSTAQELQDVVHIHEAKTVLLPYQAASPRLARSPAAPFPSPVAAPLQQTQKAQVRQILESLNTPARGKSLGVQPEVAATPLKSVTAGARTLMSMMGRTPPGGTTLPLATFSERRPPPPPKSLTVGSENMPPRNQETCARCTSAMPADANFCRYCGQQRGKKVMQAKAATPPPPRTTRRETSREPREAHRSKSSLIVDKPRFRYGSGLKKLKEMGYGDSEEVRDILTKCSGDLSAALRMINGSSPRIRA